jgi:hypothetical protein
MPIAQRLVDEWIRHSPRTRPPAWWKARGMMPPRLEDQPAILSDMGQLTPAETAWTWPPANMERRG